MSLATRKYWVCVNKLSRDVDKTMIAVLGPQSELWSTHSDINFNGTILSYYIDKILSYKYHFKCVFTKFRESLAF